MGALLSRAWLVVLMAAVVAGCGDGNSTGGDRTFRMPSPSMLPTIKVGEHVRADTHAYSSHDPQRSDIVVLHPPTGADSHQCGVPSEPTDGHPCAKPTPGASENYFLKRVVGLPGDRVAIVRNRAVIDGKKLDEPYTKPYPSCDELCNLPKPIVVPPGHFFVMGDNRGESDDSRDWGPVPRSGLIGRVVGHR